MRRNLPPLNAVRAFEAAGRCRSFTAAAAELGVTTGAISRHIKNLEEFLATRLFARGSRDVQLTTEGQVYFTQMFDLLRRMEASTADMRDRHEQQPLRVMCCASFAARWLFPRLPGFYARFPRARLAIATLASPRDTLDELAGEDVVIRCGDGSWPDDLDRHLLFRSELVPVCSPAVLAGSNRPPTPDSLAGQTLLFSRFRPDAWTRWFAAQGETGFRVPPATHFESGGLTYQAAVMGLGVALGERRFVQADIAQGLLRNPASYVYAGGEAFYFVSRRSAQKPAHLDVFRNWLVEAVAHDLLPASAPAMRRTPRRAIAVHPN